MLGIVRVSSFAINQIKADSVVNMDLVYSLYGGTLHGSVRFLCLESCRPKEITVSWWLGSTKNVHYVRLQWKTFQTIEINIRDRTGNVVPFKQGRWTWHFIFINVNSLYLVNMEGRGMTVYSGVPYQRGYGPGGLMKNIMRRATPILKASRQALQTGISVVAKGIMGGPKRKRSPKRRRQVT